MEVIYTFAGLMVSDRDLAASWYERLFGRPPAFLPNDLEAVWQVTPTSSVYILADPGRSGRSIVTLVVDDLDASLTEIATRGITGWEMVEIPGAGRKGVTADPDGNVVSVVQIFPATDTH